MGSLPDYPGLLGIKAESWLIETGNASEKVIQWRSEPQHLMKLLVVGGDGQTYSRQLWVQVVAPTGKRG